MPYSMRQLLLTLEMKKSTQSLSMRILSASNAISHTLEGEKVALRQWATLKQEKSSTQKSWSARDAVQFKQPNAKNTANSTSHLSVDFAVQLHNGFAGETRIFVMNAIKSKSQGSIFPEYQRISCLGAKERQNAL